MPPPREIGLSLSFFPLPGSGPWALGFRLLLGGGPASALRKDSPILSRLPPGPPDRHGGDFSLFSSLTL
eukprot:290457-Prymnesium_polylepis.1